MAKTFIQSFKYARRQFDCFGQMLMSRGGKMIPRVTCARNKAVEGKEPEGGWHHMDLNGLPRRPHRRRSRGGKR